MGYVAHDAVIVTVSDYVNGGEHDPRPRVEAFRASLPPEWQRLVVGPAVGVVNGDYSYAFLPDGSKENWGDSDKGDKYREQFADLFAFCYEDGSGPFSVVRVRYGGDFAAEFDEPRASYARTKPARNEPDSCPEH